jgi:molybdopterin/thiamine biosynthesis adenylyltransferase/rhodanese-related sulfurtransferase
MPSAPPPVTLSHEEITRYSRHLLMPEVGMNGQRKLKAARIVCVGAGGLGSPVAIYLAAAGIGTIGLVDFDEVDQTNLQRQVLYSTSDVGRPKLEAAADRLRALNPNVTVEAHETPLSSTNALSILRAYDLVVDGTDNFPARYLINDACVLTGRPYVYGSVFRFEGQVAVFATPDGPCYRCLYPEPPPPFLVPTCAEAGVLGVLPGIIGTIQATEAVKLILGTGEPLAGRILILEALRMRFREVRLRKDPDCAVCGRHPTIRELIDYDTFCGVAPRAITAVGAIAGTEITPEDLKRRLDRHDEVLVVDIREPLEREINRLPGAVAVGPDDLARYLGEVGPTRDVVVYCRTGDRSGRIVDELREAGFERVLNLKGGIAAWVARIDRNQPTY